jgi:hypothetical protein
MLRIVQVDSQPTITRRAEDEACEKCKAGRGPFAECVVPPDGLSDDLLAPCGNCVDSHTGSHCSFVTLACHKEPPSATKSTKGKKNAIPTDTPRKRKHEDSQDEPSPMPRIPRCFCPFKEQSHR